MRKESGAEKVIMAVGGTPEEADQAAFALLRSRGLPERAVVVKRVEKEVKR